ncbi:MAG: HNH endonuclease, partial [Deltaproteobacteria bacterium]|nr:HNH endonuclease [Deltaproteobacteria bacterium]
KIYGSEVFNEDSIVYSYPNFREKRENNLKHDYTQAVAGITGARKPIWKGFERKDGKPVKIMSYALYFNFNEDGLVLIFNRWFQPKLTDDSLRKYLEFIRKNSQFVKTIQFLSNMWDSSPIKILNEEDQVIIPFPQYIDRMIDSKYYQLEFFSEIQLPISSNVLNEFINSFVIFYPIYDSVLRIAKGEKDIFEELTSKFKGKDLYQFLDYTEDDDIDDKNNDRPEPLLTEEDEALLAKRVDGKNVVKAGMRWQVMERDDFKCVACGAPGGKDGAILEVDHIIPRSKGGKDTMDNYQTLCQRCNIGKSNKSQINLRENDLEMQPTISKAVSKSSEAAIEAATPAAKSKAPKEEKSSRKLQELPKRPGGVMWEIVDFCKKHKKKFTKAELLKILVEKFPGRSPDSMKATVNLLIPGWLGARGFSFKKHEDGSYTMTGHPTQDAQNSDGIKLLKQNAKKADLDKLNEMITVMRGLLDNPGGSTLTLEELLAFQDDDRSFKLLDSYEVSSDARVDFCHTPTYIGAAILMRELLSGRDDLADRLKQALNASCLGGHGYDFKYDVIDAMNIFIKGGLCAFLETQHTLCPEFHRMIHNILHGYNTALKGDKTKGDWNVDYREQWQSILNKLSISSQLDAPNNS